MHPRRFVIIAAGGTGQRMGLPYPKQLLPFRGSTVVQHAVACFPELPVWIPVPKEHRQAFAQVLGDRVSLVDGGATRYHSVRQAFRALPNPDDQDLILIHDAARPFLDPALLEAAWSMAATRGAVIFAAPAVDTIKQVGEDGVIQATLDRRMIYHAQTPQIFQAGLLRRAYEVQDAAGKDGEIPTDEARLLESAGIPVTVYPASHENRKLTHPEDLSMLRQTGMRIGHGYDVHRFDESRPLFLGGIEIPNSPGLLGHSDADVVTHALIDALLGAAGLGDIGRWFPDTDPQWAGIRSTTMLEKVWSELSRKGYRLANADITIQAQIPKLAPHIPAMAAKLAEVLGVAEERLNIKATTTEKLGFVGRAEGMATDAVVLLEVDS